MMVRFFHGVVKYLHIVFISCFKVLKAIFKCLFVGSVLALIGMICFAFYQIYPIYADYKEQVKDIVSNSTEANFHLGESSYIYNNRGETIAKLTLDEDSVYLPYDEIPEDAVNAFVAIEDRNFWENSGIDIRGLVRVALNYFKTDGEEVHGASTITQQLARNRFLSREVSLERKAKEMLVAMDLTKKYSKQQIMEFYINDISFANTYYGLEAASIGYFGKSAKDLTLSQIAYLCAIPNSPTFYNPYKHPENALKRRDKILNDMKTLSYITEADFSTAIQEEIVIQKTEYGFYNYETTYVIDCAVRFLMKEKGYHVQYGFDTNEAYHTYEQYYEAAYAAARKKLYTGGYQVYTSLDPAKQSVLQSTIDSVLTFDNELSQDGIYQLQGAATAIDNRNGKVVAIVGGRTQETDTYNLNRAFQSFRQPGSAIKPLIVYTPALESGYTSETRVKNINIDAAKEQEDDLSVLPGEEMTLRDAVEKSRNGVAWSVYADITPQVGMSYLLKMRFDHIVPDDFYLAASLGGFTYGATTEEMAGAYAALANSGRYKDPTCLMRVYDKEGTDIYNESEEIEVYKKQNADMMVDILTGAVSNGTAKAMGWNSNIAAAGKTGTTNSSKDGWFCGMTPYYTMAVWVGYDQPKTLSSLYGATYPASIWKQSMEQFVADLEAMAFAVPDEAVENSVAEGGNYLPGRSALEILSEGYTVGNYREDHALADQARVCINQMETADETTKAILYRKAKTLIDSIYSQKLKSAMNHELSAYAGK